MNFRQFLQQHQVKFGTSGIRAKNTALAAEVCYISTLAFLRYLKQRDFLPPTSRLALAGDLRVNTEELIQTEEAAEPAKLAEKLRQFFNQSSAVKELNCSDGLRLIFENGNIIHIRPSGNSPELRCYTEANSQDQALRLNEACLKILNHWRSQHHVEMDS